MNTEESALEIYNLQQNLVRFERNYGIPSAVFFAMYQNGEEPADSSWVLDWAEWAGSYKLLQRRLSIPTPPVATTADRSD